MTTFNEAWNHGKQMRTERSTVPPNPTEEAEEEEAEAAEAAEEKQPTKETPPFRTGPLPRHPRQRRVPSNPHHQKPI